MQSLSRLKEITLFSVLIILSLSFALGFFISGPYTLGYNLGYFAGIALPIAIPCLLLLLLRKFFVKHINRK